MAEKASNVVLNFKMDGQVEYAKTIRDINAIMNAAASEYKTHVAAMDKDATATQKLAAEKKKLEIQLEAGRKRTEQLRTEYEAMAKDTDTSTGALANKYRQLQNSERAEIALENALEQVNNGLSEQSEESRKAEEALNALEGEAESLETQTEKLNAEYELQVAQLGANAKESDKLKLKMENLNDTHELAKEKVKNYEEQLEQAKKQYGENSTEVDKYEIELIEARKAEQEFANEIVNTNKEVKEQESVLKKTSDQLIKTGEKMTSVGKDMSKKVTAPIVAAGTVAAKSAIDFESSFADVRKTVDETEEGFERLETGIREMALELPSAATEIAEVTAMAGQLGIQNEHLLTFTRTMMDLGVATDMSGETAATTLARLANITQMSQKDFDRLGSTIVGLGNNFAATESEITEMAMGIAGAGSQINMSEADILGFSTALTSVGINAQAGGSAISKLMIEMASDVETGAERLDEFARVAGMSTSEFKRAFEEDAATAIFTFLGGLGDLSEEGESAFAIIDELGLSEIRLRDTILRTSNAREMANDALATANEAWEENIALEEEAAERYKTTESQLSILKNTIVDAAIDIGNILIPVIIDVVESIKPWIEKFKELDESTLETIVKIAGLIAAIGPLLIFLGTVATAIGKIGTIVFKVIGFIGKFGKVIAALKPVLAALSGPIGWVIAAIAALIAIGVALYKNWDTIKEKAIELKDMVVGKFIELKDNAGEAITEFVSDFVDKFNELKDGLIEKVTEIKDSIVEFFTVTIPEAFNNFIEYMQEVPGRVMEFLSKLFLEDIPSAVGYGIGWLVSTIAEGIENIIVFFQELPGRILEFLTETIENITTWASEMKEKAIETGTEFVNNIINYIKELPGRIAEFLNNIITRVTTWASDMKARAMEAGRNFLNSVIDYIKQLPGRIATFLSETISKMITFASDMKDKALIAGKNVYDSIVDEVKKIPGRLKELGSDIITGLIDGVRESIGNVVGIAKEIAGNFVGGFKDAMNIKSPSRVMMEIGKAIMEGLGIGIEDMGGYAIDKGINVAKGITSAMKDGIELPEMEIGTVVRQPSNFGRRQQTNTVTDIGSNIKESLQGLGSNIEVHVYLDTEDLNTKLAPGMSRKIHANNKIDARAKGVRTV